MLSSLLMWPWQAPASLWPSVKWYQRDLVLTWGVDETSRGPPCVGPGWMSVGLGVWAWGCCCPTYRPQVWQDNGLVAICAELTGFRWGPTGPPVLLGRGSPLLSSSSRPPSCFPRCSRPFRPGAHQSHPRCRASGWPSQALTHFLFPGAKNSFPWMLGQRWGAPSLGSCSECPQRAPTQAYAPTTKSVFYWMPKQPKDPFIACLGM